MWMTAAKCVPGWLQPKVSQIYTSRLRRAFAETKDTTTAVALTVELSKQSAQRPWSLAAWPYAINYQAH